MATPYRNAGAVTKPDPFAVTSLSGFNNTGGDPVYGPKKAPPMTDDEVIQGIINRARTPKAASAALPARNGAVVPVSQQYSYYGDGSNHALQTLQGANGGGGGAAAAAQSPTGMSGLDNRNFAQVPQTGYAAKYRPAFDATVAYDNPEILARDVLHSMGIDDPVLAAQLAANGDFATLAAFLSSGGTSDADVINYLGNYFQNQSTVGGATPDTSALLGSILNAGRDPNGAIAQYLGIGSTVANPNDLANVTKITNATIQNALNDQNPYTQRAMQNYLGQLSSNYASLQAHGAAGMPDYATYLKTHGVGGFVR